MNLETLEKYEPRVLKLVFAFKEVHQQGYRGATYEGVRRLIRGLSYMAAKLNTHEAVKLGLCERLKHDAQGRPLPVSGRGVKAQYRLTDKGRALVELTQLPEGDAA